MAITMTPPITSQPTSEPQPDGLPLSAPAPVVALDIEHLTKRFEVGGRKKRKSVIAVSDVSLRIERGEIYGLLGANGSGKSTFIRLVSTLLTVEHGRVSVFGHDIVRDYRAARAKIGLVPQELTTDAFAPARPPSPSRAAWMRGSRGRTP